MLTSLAIIFLSGLILGNMFQKMKLPSLIGMILAGIIISPYGLNLLDDSILGISGDLRQLALVIILTRAGLTLEIRDLKKVGRPALLLCFLPACCEIIGVVLLAPMLLRISQIEAALLGAVLAAVSPAVIVPRMIRLMEEGYGTNQKIPQMILAGASVDDVFVIILFSSFLAMNQGKEVSMLQLVGVPISILLGIALGVFGGFLFGQLVRWVQIRNAVQVIILFSISFLFIALQTLVERWVPISGLIAIMVMGIYLNKKNQTVAGEIAISYQQLWIAAEIILFVLVGATVDLQYALSAGVQAVLLVVFALCFRMVGVYVCLLKTQLSQKERMFTMLAYTPKATVQASISWIPLSLGLSCGTMIMTVAVISILVTAPFGACCIDRSYKRLLREN